MDVDEDTRLPQLAELIDNIKAADPDVRLQFQKNNGKFPLWSLSLTLFPSFTPSHLTTAFFSS
jgi:hypothetical protein